MKILLAALAAMTIGLTASVVAPAHAQMFNGGANNHAYVVRGHGMASWSGSVDDRVNVSFQGMNSWTRVISGQSVDGARARMHQPVPNRPVIVSLTNVTGRGRVFILHQPLPRNNYTVTVRILDSQPGRSQYHFRLVW